MAIKVSGTTVINDSRELNNITSVDATTVAALGSAGVGGGGGVVSLQASGGNITQGDIVALNSDGTITAIDVAGGDDVLRSVVNPSAPVDVTTPYVTHILDTHYDSANSRIVCLIRNPSGYASAMVGVISNGAVTSWTTPVILRSNESTDASHDSANLVYNSSSGFYLACFNRSNGWVWHAAFSVNSSNVITAHNEGEVGNFYWPDLASSKCNWDSTYNRFIGGGFSGNNNAFRFMNFDWTTSSSGFITQHGQYTTSGYATKGNAVPGPNGIIVAAFGDASTLQLQAFWPNTSGQPPNASSATSNVNSASGTLWNHPKIAYNSDDEEYVLIYNLYDGNGGYAVYAMPFTFIQGSGFTTNTPVQIANESISSSNQWDVVWSSDIEQYTLVVDGGSNGLDFPDGQMTTFTFTASASTGSVSALTQGYQVTTGANEIRMFYNAALGTFGHIWNTTDLFSSVQTRVPKWVGIAKENITSGSTGDIFVLSGVSPDQSGLTPRSTYYISPSTNSLTTTATDNYKIGKALTSTKLLITEGNA